MKLFFVYTLSDLLLEEIIKSQASGEKAVVVCTTNEIQNRLADINITAFKVLPDRKSQKEHDKWFASEFMPGVFADTVFVKTTFPVWEAESIDRLRFWAANWQQIREFIGNFSPEEIVIPLDYYNPFILDHDNITAVKTHEIVSPLSRDILPNMPFKKIIVSTNREHDFVKSIVGERVEVVSREINRQRPVVSQNRIDAFIAQYGVRENVFVFDKQYTWMLTRKAGQAKTFIAVDQRSEELLSIYRPDAEIFSLAIAGTIAKKFIFIGGFNEAMYWRIPSHIDVYVWDHNNIELTNTLPLPTGVRMVSFG